MIRKEDIKALVIIFLITLCFITLRMILPHTFLNDEAEQLLVSATERLEYVRHPPIYTWILSFYYKFLGEHSLLSLTLIKYFFFFIFLSSCYYIARMFWDRNLALTVVFAELLIITYIYDFSRDLTHTVLVTAVSSLTTLCFLKLIEKATLLRYLALGLLVGIGFLSKYNFGFLALAIIVSSLLSKKGREVLLSWKALISIGISGSILYWHVREVLSHKFNSLKYTMYRGGMDEVSSYDVLAVSKSLLISLSELSLAAIVLFFIFKKFINLKAFNSKMQEHAALLQLNLLSFSSLFIVFTSIASMGLSHFYAKWLAPVSFLFILSFFSLIETKENLAKASRQLRQVVIVIFIVISAYQLIGNYFTDIAAPRRSHYPYSELSAHVISLIEEHPQLSSKTKLIVLKDYTFMSNMRFFIQKKYPELEYLTIHEYIQKKDYSGNKILVWDMKKDIEMPKRFRKHFPNAQLAKSASEYYQFSQKYIFDMGIAYTINESPTR